MDVTRENFEEAMGRLEGLLESAEFVSFDEEMSGIGFAGQSFEMMNRHGERAAARYAKMRCVASRFAIIQVGVTVWRGEEGGLVAYPFNVYVFPHEEHGGHGGDVLVSAAAVKFLNGHGMSWHRWLAKGVPYVDAAGEAALRQPKPRDEVRLSNEAEVAFCASELAKVRRLGAGQSVELAPHEHAWVRRYLYQEIERDHPSCVAEKVRGTHKIKVRAMTEREVEEKRRRADEKLGLDVGARRVYLALSRACQRGTPLVGHNCWFDLLFMMAHFDRPLDESYAAWKSRAHEHFPRVYDTKVLAQRRNAYGSLQDLYTSVLESSTLRVRFAPGFEKYGGSEEGQASDEIYHEAGFDSYATGLVFAELRRHDLQPPTLNCLFFMRSHLDVKLDLAPADAFLDALSWTPKRDLFYVTGLRGSADHVRALFRDVERHGRDGDSRWIIDAAALATATLPAGVSVVPYADRARELAAADRAALSSAPAPAPGPWWDWIRAKFAALRRPSDPHDNPPRKRPRSEPAGAPPPSANGRAP